jgi:hypothetical protein
MVGLHKVATCFPLVASVAQQAQAYIRFGSVHVCHCVVSSMQVIQAMWQKTVCSTKGAANVVRINVKKRNNHGICKEFVELRLSKRKRTPNDEWH